VHVNGTDCHDLLSVSRRQLVDQHADELVQLLNLLLVVVLEGVLIALLKTGKGYVYLSSPPDLSAAQCNLSGILQYIII